MSERWRIEHVRTGGVAGITRRAVVDSAELEPAEARAIEALLDELEDVAPGVPKGADRFQHDLAITRGGRTTRLTVGDGAAPPVVRQLLDRLDARRRASPRREA